jgi:NB-ARC domain
VRQRLPAVGWGLLALTVVVTAISVPAGTFLARGTAAFSDWAGWAGVVAVPLAAAGLLLPILDKVRGAELMPAVPLPEPEVVDRPDEVNRIVAALRCGGTVGITTALQGAGGFGKTTLAKMVRTDPQVLRVFRSRVYWVTVGRDAAGDGLALLVNGLIERINPGKELAAPGVAQAAEQLAAVLARGPRRLLVLDDVWTDEQLAAFPLAGRAVRLVTTRNPSLAAGRVTQVRVDQMSQMQALVLLQAGLPPLADNIAGALVEVTGRWPLLLRLANKILTDQVRLGVDSSTAARELLGLLRAGGTLQVDELTGAAGQQLDVADPVQRSKAIRATIQASTGLLRPADRDRLTELAVFARNETVPVPLITGLWQETGDVDPVAARGLCVRLADLALLTLESDEDGGTIAVHDVIRDYLCGELTAIRLAELHQILLDAIARDLPAMADVAGPGMVTAWWELPEDARYLREHLIEHMLAAGRDPQAESISELHRAYVNRLVEMVVATFTERQQQIYQLRYVQELNGRQAAPLLGITAKAASNEFTYLRQRISDGFGALMLFREGRACCRELAQIIEAASVSGGAGAFTTRLRERIVRHVSSSMTGENCGICNPKLRELAARYGPLTSR